MDNRIFAVTMTLLGIISLARFAAYKKRGKPNHMIMMPAATGITYLLMATGLAFPQVGFLRDAVLVGIVLSVAAFAYAMKELVGNTSVK